MRWLSGWRCLACKPDDLCPVRGLRVNVEGENQMHNVFLWSPPTCCGARAPSPSYSSLLISRYKREILDMEQETWHTHPGGVSKAHSEKAKRWLQVSHTSWIDSQHYENYYQANWIWVNFSEIQFPSLLYASSLQKISLFNLWVCACMYECALHECQNLWRSEESVGPLDLELQVVMNHHEGSE